jgi:hypothetical protein
VFQNVDLFLTQECTYSSPLTQKYKLFLAYEYLKTQIFTLILNLLEKRKNGTYKNDCCLPGAVKRRSPTRTAGIHRLDSAITLVFTTVQSFTILKSRKHGLISEYGTELTRGPPELVQHFHFKREFTSAQERCMS